ncbi:MAG: replicative DNA helicase [Flammeovirgaceae bacterium]
MAKKDFSNKSSVPRLTKKDLADAGLLTKIPPQDQELEQAVLGALMLEKDSIIDVIELLRPEVFYNPKHKEIFMAIRELFSNSEPIDILTTTNQLRVLGKLEEVGGAFYITQLTNRVNQAGNVVYYSRILLQYYIKRELIAIANNIQKEAYEDTTDVFNLLDQMEQNLFEISELNIRKNYSDMRSIMAEAIQELESMKEHKDGLTGVPSGFSALDRVTSGWQKSDLIILAARPAMGKTAFVITCMRNAAVDFNQGVALFSLEMSNVQLVKRLISAEAELESEKLKTGKLDDEEWQRMVHKTSRLTSCPIFIDDTPALTVLELRAKCRRLKAQHDIQMIIIDYLQLMSGDSKGGNREQEIAHISRSLKQLAKELNVPVIALSQLSRAVETRGGDKRPQLSDLRESGSIEQDADMVIFLYRPEYYGITEDEEGNSVMGMGEVIIAKHRNGSLENVPLKFIGKYTKFQDWEASGYIGGNFDNNLPPSAYDFTQQEGGSAETITMSSKMNTGTTPDLGDGNIPPTPDEEVPF